MQKPNGGSAVERRLSPRLHKIRETQKDGVQRRHSPRLCNYKNPERRHVSSASRAERKLSPSPRCNQMTQLKAEIDVPQESGIQIPESDQRRRRSARLHKMPEIKTPFYGTNPPKREFSTANMDVSHNDDSVNAKRTKVDLPKDIGRFVASTIKDTAQGHEIDSKHSHSHSHGASTATKEDDSSPNAAVRSAYAKVRETLRSFNTHYLHYVQEEEERCKKTEVTNVNGHQGSKTKDNDASEESVKRSSKRPDLKAITKMIESKAILYPEKRVGHLPGIDVGYQFFSRAEMVAVGFHGHWLNGIDYMGQSYGKLKEYKGYTFPLAVAIVLSGQYEDDLDDSEDIVYTGQGGNDLLGNKRQIQDQVLLRGNLALKNNMEQSIPVRVIRGHENTSSYCGKVYTYDGLYKVIDYWAEKGVSGFTVYKYRLRRLEGQPKLTSNQVQFVRGRPLRVLSELPGLVCSDICNGQENICIPVTNLIDDTPFDSTCFSYSKSVKVSESVTWPPKAPGCCCKGNCTNPRTCACAKLNGSDFPYVRRDGGRLVEAKDVVFECGPNCGCGPGCINRTSQRGLKYHLEVYRTPNKGWAVRSWDFIPSGAPVCEYIGVVRRSDELDNVSENDYIFEIDCWQTINGIEGRERRSKDVPSSCTNLIPKMDEKASDTTPEYCIDAGSFGNIARFINHSCEPNLFVQCVLSSHHDIRLARVVLFAADNIPPLQELTYDYGYALDSVIGADGKTKILPCYCGSADCRKRLY